jgi:hypothetical protein
MKTKNILKSSSMLIASLALFVVSCSNNSKTDNSTGNTQSLKTTTAVTDENYALAETQVIFTDYVSNIAAITNTNGVGVFMHKREGADPKDHTRVRINFDTRFSVTVLDLTEEAVLTMPETNGRYQSAWFITEEHDNPIAFSAPGEYAINQENTGSKYVMIVIRTQVNMKDPADMAIVSKLQDGLKLTQKDRGSYKASDQWDMEEILAMRGKYQKIVEEKGITTDVMFGKKGEQSLENRNGGVAYGWGGFTKDQAVYPAYTPETTDPATFTLKDVPVDAFWSVTIYDQNGYPQGDIYNINSSFAKASEDGSVTIHFGGDENADNFMDIFDGWNFTLRLYQPKEEYFNGTWIKPELILVK